MSRALATALEKLVAADGSAAASTFTSLQRKELDLFSRQTRSLTLVSQGGGARYETTDLPLVRSHLNVLRPTAHSDLDLALPQRANNIARMRDSKSRHHGHTTGYLLIKSIGPGVTWSLPAAITFDVSANTSTAGVAAISITVSDEWTTSQPIWLVENQALFDRTDWLPAGANGSLVYYGGQLSNLFLNWTARKGRAEKIMFFPDYDGVGFLNYARLLEKSVSPVDFWLMPGWKSLLQKYGNNVVWQSTFREFKAGMTRLLKHNVPVYLTELGDTMSRSGLALEHEAVWLKQ